MKWFKHDSNASIDSKLKRVRMKYGMEGYGLYWYCLELIAKNVEKHNLTFELEEDAELIAVDTNIHQERVQAMMTDFLKWSLFENTEDAITCLKMATRTDEYTQKLIRDLGKPALLKQRPDSVPIKSDLIEEKRIEENKKEEKRKNFIPPTVDQVKSYCDERKNNIDPEHFVDYYLTVGWMRGRAKIKDWKAVIRYWERNEIKNGNKPKSKPRSDRDWQTLGAENGINAKPGESMWNYISRVKETVYGH